jgi:hypothetical protein
VRFRRNLAYRHPKMSADDRWQHKTPASSLSPVADLLGLDDGLDFACPRVQLERCVFVGVLQLDVEGRRVHSVIVDKVVVVASNGIISLYGKDCRPQMHQRAEPPIVL